jgi:hypothetical protein
MTAVNYYPLKVKDGSGNVQKVGDDRVKPHIDATTSVHGIADTSQLETLTGAQDKADSAEQNAKDYADGLAANYDAAGAAAAAQTAAEDYTDTAISNLIDGAPAALDTLNELAAALGDDASYASTITTALSAKAPLASPALTGTPTAPTASADTNTTQVATTAYVVGQGYLKSATASYTYAPLASPSLTGTPTAPTASAGTNTTQLATTAFVKAAVDAASPSTGTITSDMIANGTIVDADISSSAAIAQSKISGLTTALDGKPDLFVASTTPGSFGVGDFWLDTSAAI